MQAHILIFCLDLVCQLLFITRRAYYQRKLQQILILVIFLEDVTLYIIFIFTHNSLSLYYAASAHIDLYPSVMAFSRMKYSVKYEWMHIDINGLVDEKFWSILRYFYTAARANVAINSIMFSRINYIQCFINIINFL